MRRHLVSGTVLALAAAVATTAAGPASSQRPGGRLLRVREPLTLATGAGSVWVATGRALLRIAPRSDSVVARIRLPETAQRSLPGMIVVTGQTLWLVMTPIETTPTSTLASELWSIDTRTNTLEGRPVRLPFATDPGIAAAAGSLWLTNDDHAEFGRLYQLRPRTRSIIRTLRIPDAPWSIVTDRDRLWLGESDSGVVVSVNPHGGRITGKRIRTGGASLTLAVAGGRLWVADAYKHRLLAIDPAAGRLTSTSSIAGLTTIAVVDGTLWAVRQAQGQLIRINPHSGVPTGTSIVVHGGLEQIAAGGGYLWALGRNGVTRLSASSP